VCPRCGWPLKGVYLVDGVVGQAVSPAPSTGGAQNFFNSSTSACGPFLMYSSHSRCASADRGTTFPSSGRARFCRDGTHTLPSSNCTWFTKPVIFSTLAGRAPANNRRVDSCVTDACLPGGR